MAKTEEHHGMIKVQTFSTGAEEWWCPICGRKFIVTWPPAYKRIITVQGNTEVTHFSDMEQAQPQDPYLEPWERFMEGRQ
jgi:hypothetical protein